jgi:hypothetical protein
MEGLVASTWVLSQECDVWSRQEGPWDVKDAEILANEVGTLKLEHLDGVIDMPVHVLPIQQRIVGHHSCDDVEWRSLT